MTSRPRKPTGEKTHRQHPARTRHSDSTNASPLSIASPANGDQDDSGAPAEERDRLAAVTDLALARRRQQTAHANRVYGAPDVERSVPGLDRQALDAKTYSGTEGCSYTFTITGGSAPDAVGMHPQPRGTLERPGRTLLRRVADDLRLGRARCRRRRPLTAAADGGGRDRVPAKRLLDLLAAAPMAEHFTTLPAVRVKGQDLVTRSGLEPKARTESASRQSVSADGHRRSSSPVPTGAGTNGESGPPEAATPGAAATVSSRPGLTATGALSAAAMREAEQSWADQQDTVTACFFCDWTHQGTAFEGRQAARDHRMECHPEACVLKARRRRRTQTKRSVRSAEEEAQIAVDAAEARRVRSEREQAEMLEKVERGRARELAARSALDATTVGM